MLPRFRFLLNKSSLSTVKWRFMSADYTPTVKEPHMNDVPHPEKFEDVYRQRQVGNNAMLICGLAFFSLTAFIVSKSGVLYLNPMPPKKNLE